MNGRLEFIVDGIAQPKGSTKMVPTEYRGTVITSANPKLKAWEEDVAWTAQHAMIVGQIAQFTGPVALHATFFLPRPKSVPAHVEHDIKKPDLDKLLRAVNDALSGVAYVDDNQVVDCHGYKRYAVFEPHASITVSEVRDEKRDTAGGRVHPAPVRPGVRRRVDVRPASGGARAA
jgi:crossover junction endodeoxyribonuclease RusA